MHYWYRWTFSFRYEYIILFVTMKISLVMAKVTKFLLTVAFTFRALLSASMSFDDFTIMFFLMRFFKFFYHDLANLSLLSRSIEYEEKTIRCCRTFPHFFHWVIANRADSIGSTVVFALVFLVTDVIIQGIRFSIWWSKYQIGVVSLYYALIMEVVGEDALSFTMDTFMNTILLPAVVFLVFIRLVEHANSGAVVVFALMIAKVPITTVMTFQLRVVRRFWTWFFAFANIAFVFAFVVAVVTFVIVFMAVKVSTQKRSLDATFINFTLSLTNMTRLAVTVLFMIQPFLTKSFALTTCLVAILSFRRVDFKLIFQLFLSLRYNTFGISLLRQ